MQEKTGEQVDSYIRRQRNAFPQTFCEFVTLGNVALHDHRDKYHPIQQYSDVPVNGPKVIPFHAPDRMDSPQEIWLNGKQVKIVPMEVIKSLGIA